MFLAPAPAVAQGNLLLASRNLIIHPLSPHRLRSRPRSAVAWVRRVLLKRGQFHASQRELVLILNPQHPVRPVPIKARPHPQRIEMIAEQLRQVASRQDTESTHVCGFLGKFSAIRGLIEE